MSLRQDPRVADRARNGLLLRGITSSVIGKTAGLAAPIVTIPVTYSYLGPARYGLWIAATSLTSMALFADFGIGNGVLTMLADSHARADHAESARIVSSAYCILSAIAGALLVLVSAMSYAVDWAGLFDVTDDRLGAEAPLIILVCLSAFAVNIPLSLIQRLQYAVGHTVRSNLWEVAASVLTTVVVIAAVTMRLPPIVVIISAAFALPLTNLVNTLSCPTMRHRSLAPRWAMVEKRSAQRLAGVGAQFFVISVITSVALNSDTFLVASALGPEAAAHYSIVARMYATLSLFVTLVGLVLWPANSQAIANGDIRWVRRTTRRTAYLTGSVVLAGGTMLAFSTAEIMEAWLGSSEAEPDLALVVALLAWSLLIALASPLFMVQNSVGELRPQLIGWAVFLPFSLGLKWALVTSLGLPGVPIAGAVTYLAIIMPVAYYGYASSLRKAESRMDAPAPTGGQGR